MSIGLPTASVILGSREHCCLCTYHGGERNAKARLSAQGVFHLSFTWPPGSSRKRLKASIRCSRSEQDSFRKDEGNGRQLTGANSPLRAPKVAPTHEGLVGRNPNGETSKENDASGDCIVDPQLPSEQKRVGSDLNTLIRRFWKVAAPYWSSEDKVQARLRLAGVFALTLATTGISVGFNFLGRDFYNALASKDEERFMTQLLYYLGAFIAGIPVFVFRDYGRETLSLRWRAWMTKFYMSRYFDNRTFYNIQSQSLIDNPDQRIVDDLNAFTGTALSFALALFNATIDLISFSGILYGIYPPLFGVLIVYSLGGTAISVALGKGLVGLNFMQEKREADFRYGLVRVRENAESIAFYGGELNEIQLLIQRFKESFNNYSKLLIASRNLDFFTSGYRYLIQLLPAAVVAPLYFAGKIEFGVINQSFSAFNHILGDFSIIVYQFQSISAFSAVVDRLGEFTEILDQQNGPLEESAGGDSTKDTYTAQISLLDLPLGRMDREQQHGEVLLEICNLTLRTPQNTMTLVNDLSLRVHQGEHLLVMGASGTGKTSLLRAVAGLWRSGDGTIKRYIRSEQNEVQADDGTSEQELSTAAAPTLSNSDVGVFFVPQRPYMVLGSLRQQLLYPTWTQGPAETASEAKDSLPFLGSPESESVGRPIDSAPDDDELLRTLEKVRLEHLMSRCDGLDSRVEWSSILSLGEQQRLAFARLLLTRPALALMDESTSALDESNEAHLYSQVQAAGVTFISVGHRSTLLKYHTHILQLTESQDNTGCKWALGLTQQRLQAQPEIQTTSRSD